MVHVIFDVNSINVEDVLNSQRGRGLYFEGMPYQRGYGIQRGGGFFRSILRYLMPSLKSAGKALVSEGLSTGSRILGDLSEGKDLKESIVQEGKQGVKNLAEKTYKRMYGGKRSLKRKRVVGRSVGARPIKRRRIDNLGFY